MDDHSALAVRAATDERAFAELYALYIDQLYGFVMKRVGHPETTEDIVADIFRKVFLNLQGFTAEKASFRTWMYRIATNTIIDHYRVNRNENKPVIVDLEEALALADQASTDDLVLSQEQKHAVQQCINQLPEKAQKIVQLKFFDDCSHQEIGEILGITPGNVGVQVHRAVKQLKTIIEKQSAYALLQ